MSAQGWRAVFSPAQLRCSAVFIPAPLFAVEVLFRTSLCGQTFSGSQSPVATCHRAALMIGLPLCLQRSGYLSRFACAGLSPVGATQHVCPQPDLNRHTKALAIELQGHVRIAVCTTIVIICEVYRALSHRQVATLPSGTAHRSCTFATPLLRNAAPLPY